MDGTSGARPVSGQALHAVDGRPVRGLRSVACPVSINGSGTEELQHPRGLRPGIDADYDSLDHYRHSEIHLHHRTGPVLFHYLDSRPRRQGIDHHDHQGAFEFHYLDHQLRRIGDHHDIDIAAIVPGELNHLDHITGLTG
jgi:hypothetical protein